MVRLLVSVNALSSASLYKNLIKSLTASNIPLFFSTRLFTKSVALVSITVGFLPLFSVIVSDITLLSLMVWTVSFPYSFMVAVVVPSSFLV